MKYIERSYESYHHNSFKNHHDASQKQNQTRYSRGTVWLCGGKNAKSTFLRTIIKRALEVRKEICASLTPPRYLTECDMKETTTNTAEDRWERSASDLKHALGTGSSNADWLENQLMS